MNPQHIVVLDIKNFERIEAFNAKFNNDSGLVILTGNNEAGKSSILNAIEAAVTGNMPAEPLRNGTRKGSVLLKTEDFVFETKITDKGSYFTLTGPDGKVGKPRALLSSFYSTIGFDPLEFARMKPLDQAAELLRVCPVDLDLDENAREKERLYSERTIANREVKRIEAVLESMPKPNSDVPEPVDVKLLYTKLDELQRIQHTNKLTVDRSLALKVNIKAHEGIESKKRVLVDQYKELLSEAESELQRASSNLEQMRGDESVLEDQVAALVDPDTDEASSQIDQSETINRVAAEAKHDKATRDDAEGQLVDAEKQANDLDDRLNDTIEARALALRDAKFPVDDLTIDEAGLVRLKDVPLSQSSTAQQMKLGVELAGAANTDLRVIIIRDGAMMDDDSMAFIEDYAYTTGRQVWIERITDDDPQAIRIVDGNRA